MTTMATATRALMTRTTFADTITIATIGGTTRKSSNSNTTTIATFTDTTSTSNIITTIDVTKINTITIDTIITTTTTTSVIDKIASDTGAGVSEFTIRWIRARAAGAITTQTIPMRLLMAYIILLIVIELAEWVGLNETNDNYWLSLMTGKIK